MLLSFVHPQPWENAKPPKLGAKSDIHDTRYSHYGRLGTIIGWFETRNTKEWRTFCHGIYNYCNYFYFPTIGTCTDQQCVTLLLGNGPACAQAPNCLFMTMTAYNNYGHHCNREWGWRPKRWWCVLRHNANYVLEFARKERNLHCDVEHNSTVWISRLILDHAIAAIQT